MFCKNCGTELSDEVQFCTACGTATKEKEAVSLNPAADKILSVLRDKKFLVLCIALSADILLSLTFGGLPLLQILFAIFLWLSFAKGQKGVVHAEHLRCVSGTVYAQYVITNVIGILLAVVGVLSGAVMIVFGDAAEFVDGFSTALNETAQIPVEILGLGIRLLGVLLVAVLVGVSVVMLLINWFAMRKFHRFAKSVYQSVDHNTLDFYEPKAVYNWMMAFTVFSGITSLFGFTDGIETVLSGAIMFVVHLMAALLIKKYFEPQPQLNVL